jgi:hypothetical protein
MKPAPVGGAHKAIFRIADDCLRISKYKFLYFKYNFL